LLTRKESFLLINSKPYPTASNASNIEITATLPNPSLILCRSGNSSVSSEVRQSLGRSPHTQQPAMPVRCKAAPPASARRITAAAGTKLAGAPSAGTVIPSLSSPPKGLYNPKAFITHAAWLDHAYVHCPIFPAFRHRNISVMLFFLISR
jgi:hypothetical protein